MLFTYNTEILSLSQCVCPPAAMNAGDEVPTSTPLLKRIACDEWETPHQRNLIPPLLTADRFVG